MAESGFGGIWLLLFLCRGVLGVILVWYVGICNFWGIMVREFNKRW